MRTRIVTVLVMVAAMMALAAPAAASSGGIETVEGPSIMISDKTIERNVAEGELRLLGSVSVDPELRGLSCPAMAEGINNESPRTGSNLLLVSGDSSVPILDVERTPNARTPANGTLVMGETMDVYLVGPVKVFSGGVEVSTECFLPEPVGETSDPCNSETGETSVTLENRGQISFSAAILDGDGNVVASDPELAPGHSVWYLFTPGNVWSTMIDDEMDGTGEAENCKETPPETTTTTTPPPTATTMPPSQGDIAEAVNAEPLESGRMGGLVLVAVSLGLAFVIAVLGNRNSRRGRRESF